MIRALDVTCPVCDAKPGQNCVTTVTRVERTIAHEARHRAAERSERDQATARDLGSIHFAPLDMRCPEPFCKAEPDEPCKTGSGAPRRTGNEHALRNRAADRLNRRLLKGEA